MGIIYGIQMHFKAKRNAIFTAGTDELKFLKAAPLKQDLVVEVSDLN